MKTWGIGLLAAGSLVYETAGMACSTLAITQQSKKLLLKSYDWSEESGVVHINPRGLKKRAFQKLPGTPLEWTSQYGSISFNQFGTEFSNGGINEAGLVVEVLWLPPTIYPDPVDDNREKVSEAQWVQYLLDKSSSIRELVENAKNIDVLSHFVPIHLFACDEAGLCATLEYIDKQLVIHQGDDLSLNSKVATAITNSTYADSLAQLSHYVGFGGLTPIPTGARSTASRFVRAVANLQKFCPTCPQATVTHGFELLDNVKQGDFTKWQIVYNQTDRIVHFRSHSFPATKTLRLADFQQHFECIAPAGGETESPERRALFIGQGDVDTVLHASDFEVFSTSENTRLVEQTVGSIPSAIPGALVTEVAEHASNHTYCDPGFGVP